MSNAATGNGSVTTAKAPSPPPGNTARDLIRLRDDTCALLLSLDEAAKARASIVRSCMEAAGLSAAEVEALKDLLRCITDQRKRMRAVRRLWQSLDVYERPSAELVEATGLCVRECRELAAALDPLRAQTVRQVHRTVGVTWTRLAKAATQFTAAAAPSGSCPQPDYRSTYQRA